MNDADVPAQLLPHKAMIINAAVVIRFIEMNIGLQ
jgi:hypothetical protein